MAKTELMEEPAASGISTGPLDVLVGLSGPIDPTQLRAARAKVSTALSGVMPNANIAIAYMDVGSASFEAEEVDQRQVRLLPYKPSGTAAGSASWIASSAAYASLFALMLQSSARANVIVNPDLAALDQGAVARLANPILSGECELAMPIYSQSRFAGLLSASILAPLMRALYGKRVRFPLAQDFAVAPKFLSLLQQPLKHGQASGDHILWPVTEAAVHERKFCQVYVDFHHETAADGVDLSTVLAQLLGPLFSDMEANAPVWQRVRGSHASPVQGSPFPAAPEVGKIDTRPMVESFSLATRNLQDVWSLLLPPVTQLELKRLARSQPEQFRIPDALWVRIVYDFALAHRLKILSRSHLMGAFTPLYLAWVASYAGEVSSMTDTEVDARQEQLALAYESGKPYLLSRWRWPDRFNP